MAVYPPSIPRLGIGEGEVRVNQPADRGRGVPLFPPAQLGTTDACSVPLSMTKVVSGPFEAGLSMDSYYPDLVGSGYWAHGAAAGPFDTGTRCGSNVQLYGTFPSPCRPELFSLAQTVTHDLMVFNGTRDPEEGTTSDDIAASGRDASRAPFRQDWLGGGYNVSMADPPSLLYSAVRDAQWDRTFVTSLVGPGGGRSVTWNTSIRVAGGRVTRNTVS